MKLVLETDGWILLLCYFEPLKNNLLHKIKKKKRERLKFYWKWLDFHSTSLASRFLVCDIGLLLSIYVNEWLSPSVKHSRWSELFVVIQKMGLEMSCTLVPIRLHFFLSLFLALERHGWNLRGDFHYQIKKLSPVCGLHPLRWFGVIRRLPLLLDAEEREGDRNPAGNTQQHQKCFVQEI